MALNMDKIKAKQAELSGERKAGSSSDRKYFTPQEGDNHIRILPPMDGEDTFYFEFLTHFGVGPNNETVECPRSFVKKAKCPICDIVSELYKGDEEDKKNATALRAKSRYRVNMINLDKPEDGVQIYEFGKLIAQDLLSFIVDDDYGDITDLGTGRDITTKRTGTKRDTKYTIMPRPVASSLDTEVMELAHDLRATFTEHSLDEIEAILDGEDKEERATKAAAPKAAPKAAAKEEADDSEPPFDADEAPKATGSTSKADILARLKKSQA